MYYLTVKRNDECIVERKSFDDFAAAVAYTSQFYEPRAGRAVIEFATEVINGRFARSYASLDRPEDVEREVPFNARRYHVAAKRDNAVVYDAHYFFMIESEVGTEDRQAFDED